MAALPYPAYGFSAALLPDGGVTPYPAYVSGATRGYGPLYCRMAA